MLAAGAQLASQTPAFLSQVRGYRGIAVIPFVGVADALLAGLAVVHGKDIHIQRDMAHLQRRHRCADGLKKLNAGIIQQRCQGLGIFIKPLA
jgi:hypothetical protein